MGRGFELGEDVGRNAHPVTVIAYQTWKERYNGDPAIVGKTQMLNGVRHTIIGVAPEGFFGTFVGYKFQFWAPASEWRWSWRGSAQATRRKALWNARLKRLSGCGWQ
jgi:MacB-like protein